MPDTTQEQATSDRPKQARSETRSTTVTLSDFPPGLLAVPTIPWMWTESAAAIGALQGYLPPNSRIAISGAGPSSIARARNNQIAVLFSEEGSRLEWVLCVDSDMVPPRHTAIRLLAIARGTGAGIVSALYFQRTPPYEASLLLPGVKGFLLAEDMDQLSGVVEAEVVGMGCALIHREVFEAVGSPWYNHPPDKPGNGEDFDFCRRARAHGFQILVDTDLEVGHLTTVAVTREFARAWNQTPTGRAQIAGDEMAGDWRAAQCR